MWWAMSLERIPLHPFPHDGWTIAWARTGHFNPRSIADLNFEKWRPRGLWFATKTHVFVRPLPYPYKEIAITVVGVSEPIRWSLA